MKPSIHHHITDDGVRVNLTSEAGRAVTATLSAAALKRFAWGVLADLDPEEASACGMPQEGAPRTGETQVQKIGRVLYARGPLQHKDIAAATGINGRGAVSARLASMIELGSVQKAGKHPTTGRDLYTLTAAGRRAYEEGLV